MRKGWKRVHRLVVLPDYQGIGIGLKFINKISEFFAEDNYNINLTTTTPALVHALKKNKNWVLIRADRIGSSMKNWSLYYGEQHKEKKGHGVHHLDNKSSKNRITYSFNFTK
jgi:hypothetical protein